MKMSRSTALCQKNMPYYFWCLLHQNFSLLIGWKLSEHESQLIIFLLVSRYIHNWVGMFVKLPNFLREVWINENESLGFLSLLFSIFLCNLCSVYEDSHVVVDVLSISTKTYSFYTIDVNAWNVCNQCRDISLHSNVCVLLQFLMVCSSICWSWRYWKVTNKEKLNKPWIHMNKRYFRLTFLL